MAPSIAEAYRVPQYERPKQTKEDLELAPLVEIDISCFNEPGEKERLVAKLEDTVRDVGFWIVHWP